MKHIVYLAALAASIAAAAAGGRAGARPQAIPPPTQFSARVTNPWFPLVPGTRYLYVGVKGGRPSRDLVTVSRATRTIMGVPCAVVRDRLYLAGRLEERTTDWYSQDSKGNVWYLGEDTAELDARGRVTSTSGTWTAGVDGAQPGIYMPADPHVGQSGRQEYYRGRAEDHFAVIGLFRTVTGAPAASTLLTKETTPLEPGTVDHKLYVRGIGTVLEQTEKGPNERNELVSVSRGR